MIKFAPHESDAPLVSTLATLKDIDNTPFWIDVKNFLKARIEDHQKVLEGAESMPEIIRSQAIIANCRDILELPNLFTAELETEDNGETTQ